MDSPDIFSLQKKLDYNFKRIELLKTALTKIGAGDRLCSNERLEFLGDRVLGLIIAAILFERFPKEDEGKLARRYAFLVSRDALARVAEKIDLCSYLILAPGEQRGRHNPAILADCSEALMAALYLDGGLSAAAVFIRRFWMPLIEEAQNPPKDAKTALQELAQGRGLSLPVYRELARTGPDHAPMFTIEVSVENLGTAVAKEASKRTAEHNAAKALLEQLGV